MMPHRAPGQGHDAHQADMAEWLGCTVARMNADHDALHRALTAWTGVPSQSLREAAGEALSGEDQRLAALEEEAVLCVQRWMVAAGAGVPG